MNRGFRLDAVERMRARRLADAGQALARARQALAEAMAERDLLHRRLLDCLPDSPSRPEDMQVVGHRRAQLRDRIRAADTGTGRLQARVEAAREDWLSARDDLRAVQALRERYRRALRAEQDRREQRLANEFAAARLARRVPRRVPRRAGTGDPS